MSKKRESTTLSIKRSELTETADLFRQASAVTPCEADFAMCSSDVERQERREQLTGFKYSAGRNFKSVMSVIKRTQKEVDKITEPSKEYMQYIQERHTLQLEYAQKGEDGCVIHEQHEDGSVRYLMDKEREKQAEAELKKLDKKYAAEIKGYKAQVKQADKHMEQKVDIDIRTVPWAWCPTNVTGTYMIELKVMMPDCPHD